MSDETHTSHGNGASHGDFAKIFNYYGKIEQKGASPRIIRAAVTIPLCLDNEVTRKKLDEHFNHLLSSLDSGSEKVCDSLKENDLNSERRHKSILDRLLGSDAADPARRGRNFLASLILFFFGVGVMYFGAHALTEGISLAMDGRDDYAVQVESQRKHQASIEYPVKQKETETREAFVERCKANVAALNAHRASVNSAKHMTKTGIRLACASITELMMSFVLMIMSTAFLSILYFADMIWTPANADKIFPKTREKIAKFCSKRKPNEKK